jgi:hypothetical protein
MKIRWKDTGESITADILLQEHFPYVRRGELGEFIIPADKVAAFVQKYTDLANAQEHLEQLRLYRDTVDRGDMEGIDD